MRAVPVGVCSTSCGAGKSVNATTQEMLRPSAVQIPSSRMGRTVETASAANPKTAANVETVTGSSLLRSAASWCSRSGTPSGRSTNRDCKYTSVARVVTSTVSGTSTETMVKVKPSRPPAATPRATAATSVSTKASSVRTDLYSSSAVPTTSAAKNGKYRADAAPDWCSIHDWT